MSKAKLTINPESKEVRKLADPKAWHEEYLFKKNWKADEKAEADSQRAKKDDAKKTDDDSRKKISNGETLGCLIATIIVSSFGFNNDNEEPTISEKFRGLIILSIIPEDDAGRDAYYNGVVGYLIPAVVTRLLISAAHLTAFTNLIGPARSFTGTPPNTNSTPGTWNYIYPLQSNKATRTTTLTTAKKAIIKAINTAIHNMYADIPDNVIIPADTAALNIVPKANRQDPTDPAKITALVIPVVEALGGGKIRVKSKQSASAKRGKKLNDAVEIEFSYILVDARTGAIPATVPVTIPPSVTVLTVSEANVVITLPDTALGMRIVLFARWIYVKHPDKSGGYGTSGNDIVS
jgi:hypothetical protein